LFERPEFVTGGVFIFDPSLTLVFSLLKRDICILKAYCLHYLSKVCRHGSGSGHPPVSVLVCCRFLIEGVGLVELLTNDEVCHIGR